MILGFEPIWRIYLLRLVPGLSFLIPWIFLGATLLLRIKQTCLWYPLIYTSIFHSVSFPFFLTCKVRQLQLYILEMLISYLLVLTLTDFGCHQKVFVLHTFTWSNFHFLLFSIISVIDSQTSLQQGLCLNYSCVYFLLQKMGILTTLPFGGLVLLQTMLS